MTITEHQRKSMRINENQKTICENQWISTKISENPWTPMKIKENHWTSMKIRRATWWGNLRRKPLFGESYNNANDEDGLWPGDHRKTIIDDGRWAEHVRPDANAKSIIWLPSHRPTCKPFSLPSSSKSCSMDLSKPWQAIMLCKT